MNNLQKEAARRAKIMIAFSQGKKIRRKRIDEPLEEQEWVIVSHPLWDWHLYIYEVIPQTVEEAACAYFNKHSNWCSREDYFIAGWKAAKEQSND